MTRTTINKIMVTMLTEMYYSTDVHHVSASKISDEYRDWNEIGHLGDSYSINNGLWHTEYDEERNEIWIFKTKYTAEGKACGYIPKYFINLADKNQIQICAEFGYWLMQIRLNEIKGC